MLFRTIACTLCCFAVVPLFAQEAKPADDKPAEMKITYDQHILPLLREKCGTCHNANDKKGDLVLDNFGAAMRGGASGEVIRSDGDAENSYLYRVVAHLDEPFMPPSQPKMADEQLALIRKWIEGGALENAGSVSKVKKMNVVTRVEVSNQRPAGPPPLPENLPLDPLLVSSRANAVTALAVNPWSPLAAVSGHKQVLLYNTSTLELAGVLAFPEGQPHVLKFSRNGQILLVGGGRGSHSGKVVLFDVKTGNRVAEIGDEYDVVLAADLSADQTLVALGGPKKMVRVYSVATGEQLYELKKHTDWVTAIEFSPDGVLLATGDRSNGLIVWESDTGREFYTLNGHTNVITDITWAPDSNSFASSSEDASVRLWGMQNGNQIKTWGAHGGGTTSVEAARDGRIVSVGRDGRGKLWDAGGNAQRSFDPLPDLGTAASLCAETDRVLIGDLTGAVHVYNAKDGAKLGTLTTNPPALATRIQQTQQQLAQLETAATQATAQVAALKKGIADRQATAEAAAKAAADALAAVDPATKAKAAADADLAAKQQALTAAQQALTAAEAARTKSTADHDATGQAITATQTALKAVNEAAMTAQAAAIAAQQAVQAKPGDAATQQAALDATQKAVEALGAVTEATKKHAEALQQFTTATQTLSAAVVAFNAAKSAADQATAAKAAADQAVTDATAKLQAAQQLAASKKTDADKAAAAAQVTPEQQKQLAEAEAAALSATDRVATAKDQLGRLQAAQNRPAQTAAAN
jgi:hypothetical protein